MESGILSFDTFNTLDNIQIKIVVAKKPKVGNFNKNNISNVKY